MSGVKNFLRRLSYREPKKNQPKSASTSHLPHKFQQQQQTNDLDSNIPYCLRQLQLQNETNNNNNKNKDHHKELSKSHDYLRGAKHETNYADNLERDHIHHHHHQQQHQQHHHQQQHQQQQPSLNRSSNYNSLKNIKDKRVNDSMPILDGVQTLQRIPRHYSSTNFSTTGRCQIHGSGNRGSNTLQNLKPKDTKLNNVGFDTLRKEQLYMDEKSWIFEDVILRKTRQGQGLGFTVAGGRDAPGGVHIDSQRSVFVQRLISGGLAMEDGRLRPRDIIISINGIQVKSSTHIHVVELLKNSTLQVHLKVKRHPNMSGRLVEVTLQKDSNVRGLGFSISGGVGTPELPDDDCVLVTKIFSGGVAGEDGRMKVGDKILFVDDLDMTGRTHDEAVHILKSAILNKNHVTIQLLRKQDIQEQQSITTGNNNNNTMSNDDVIYSKVIKKEVKLSSVPSPNHKTGVNSPQGATLHKPRRIIIRRGQSTGGLGINIVGGMRGMGLFVNYVLPGSPTIEQTDLRRGDKLLRVNHVDLRGVSHQEAVSALKNSGDDVVIIAQYKPEELDNLEKWISEVSEKPESGEEDNDDGNEVLLRKQVLPSQDDVFLRSLFDYDPFLDVTFSPFDPAPIERLKVKFGDVFRISRNELNSDWLQVTRVFSSEINSIKNNNKINNDINNYNYNNNYNNNYNYNKMQETGSIPGKQNCSLKSHSMNIKDMNRYSRHSAEFQTSKKRRSFIFSSKLKPSGKSGDKKLDIEYSLYQPVVLRQCLHMRPLLILGPLKDRMNDLLSSRYPHLFEGCVPHTTRPMRPGEISGREYLFVLTQDEMVRNIERSVFVEVGIYKGHYYGVSFESIGAISRQNKHCLLDVSIESLARLHAVDIYPIVVLLKSSSTNLIGSWLQTNDESRLKNITEQTELLYQQHKHMLSAIVEGVTEEDLFHGVTKVVENHSGKFMWLSSDEKIF